MAAKYSLGQSLIVKVNDLPYLGVVLTYDESVDPIMYTLSVAGKGDTMCIDETTLEEDNDTDDNDG